MCTKTKITIECATPEEREAIIKIVSLGLANAKTKKQYLPVREEYLGDSSGPTLTAPWSLVVITADRTPVPVLDMSGERAVIEDEPHLRAVQ